MKRQLLHLLFAAGLSLSLLSSGQGGDAILAVQPNSLAPLVEKTSPAVVNIYAQKLVGAALLRACWMGRDSGGCSGTRCFLAMAETGLRIRWVQASSSPHEAWLLQTTTSSRMRMISP